MSPTFKSQLKEILEEFSKAEESFIIKGLTWDELKDEYAAKILELVMEYTPEEKKLIKPSLYKHLCYGGGAIVLIDNQLSDEKVIKCQYKGKKSSWLNPACENCNGKLKGELSLTTFEKEKNLEINSFNQGRQEFKEKIGK